MLVKLKNIASFSKGQQINGNELIADGSYDFLNGGISPSGKWNQYNVKGNTIAISEGGNSCGYVNYMVNPFWCGAHCYYLFDVKINTQYLFFALKSQQERLMQLRTGACMPNIKKSDLAEFEFNMDGDVAQQLKVVNVLDKVTDLISLRKQQLSKLDELVKSQFIEMFGLVETNEFNFPICTLKEVCYKVTDGKHGGCQVEEGSGYYYVGAREIYDGVIHYETAPEISPSDFEKDYRRCNLEKGDFVIVNTGATIGKSAIAVDNRTERTLLQKSVALLKVKPDRIIPEFLKCCYSINRKMYEVQSASAQPNLLLSKINETPIYLPSLDLQNRFAAFVQQVDKSKFEIQNSLEKLELLKKALMQKYFG